MALASCQESLEDRAAREAKEYTEKFCPTPTVNYTRTDSVAFDKATKTYHYYCSVTDKMDDADLIAHHKAEIEEKLAQSIKDNTSIKAYKDAGFSFAFTLRSDKNPKTVLLQTTVKP